MKLKSSLTKRIITVLIIVVFLIIVPVLASTLLEVLEATTTLNLNWEIQLGSPSLVIIRQSKNVRSVRFTASGKRLAGFLATFMWLPRMI